MCILEQFKATVVQICSWSACYGGWEGSGETRQQPLASYIYRGRTNNSPVQRGSITVTVTQLKEHNIKKKAEK
jgi:hypothetical protein